MSDQHQIDLVVGHRPERADLRLADCESLEDFEDGLLELLATDGGLVLDLHGGPGVAITVPEAVRVLVEVADRRKILCILASERALRSAERVVPSYTRSDRRASFGGLEIIVTQGDLVRVAADAIVNASNVRLELGAGVSGAIRRAVAHPDALQAEMSAQAPIAPGDVVATGSHGLPTARYILHAATASGRSDAVGRAYEGVLDLAVRMGLSSLAVPALGTGTGGLEPLRSAELLRECVEQRSSWDSLRRLTCVLFDGATADAFAEALSAR